MRLLLRPQLPWYANCIGEYEAIPGGPGLRITLQRGKHLPLVLAHEMGHHVLHHNTIGYSLEKEVAAWTWAVQRRGKLTQRERAFIRHCLGSYL